MKRSMMTVAGAAAVMAVGLMCTAAHAETWTYTSLHPTDAISSEALGAAGGQQVGSVDGSAALWSGTATYVNLNPTDAGYSVTSDGSAALNSFGGQQVGYARFTKLDSITTDAGLWNGTAGSWTNLRKQTEPTWYDSFAHATNGTHQVGYALVDISGTNTYRPILWNGTAASAVDLTPAVSGATGGNANDISTGNNKVGEVHFTGGISHAGLWDSSNTFIDLNPAGASQSFAYAISGTQQVGSADYHAALWSGTAASFVDLHPGADFIDSCANDILGTQKVGVAYDTDNLAHAALWDGPTNTFVDLSAFLPSDFVSSQATGISSDGVTTYITGTAYKQDLTEVGVVADYSALYAFVLTQPIPEPATMSLLALGGLALIRRKRKA